MGKGDKRVRAILKKVLPLILVLVLAVTLAASCGTDSAQETKNTESATKLPPGVSEADLGETATEKESVPGEDGADKEDKEQAEAPVTPASPGASADLVGGRFTVTGASRQDNNADVISGDMREVNGDYLEVEMEIQNVGDDLIDLSHYSFRLESPGIAADTYSDYYGNNGTYGAYVSENVISATLLDYATLQPAGYLVKKGELVDKVFLFFDLNPESVATNEGVTRDNSKLVIRKVEGSDYGEEAEIPLSGYTDF